MVVFICGNATNENAERYRAVETDITDAGHKAVNPLKFVQMVGETNTEKIGKICIALLDLCDAIFLLSGAEENPFANREIGYAMAKGMRFVDDASMIRYYRHEEKKEGVQYED